MNFTQIVWTIINGIFGSHEGNDPPQMVVDKMTTYDSMMLRSCQEQTLEADKNPRVDNSKPNIYEFINFWKMEPTLKETGCMFHCIWQKQGFIGEDFKINDAKFKEFAMKSGAAPKVASDLLRMHRECHEEYLNCAEDRCFQAVFVARCIRKKIKKKEWTPLPKRFKILNL